MFFSNSVRVAPGVRSALAVACGVTLSVAKVAGAAEQAVEAVVVTANREPQSISKVLADVSVITRDEIERQGGGSNAVDLLRMLPGFEITRTGGPASVSNVFLRGAESRHLLVLIDGVRVDTQSGSGGATWEAIPASQIERIEVVRGAASAIYGSDAIAGVVQIFTRTGQGPARLELGLGVGNLGLVSQDAQVSGSQGAWSYSLGLSAERSSGFNARSNTVPGTRAADDDGYTSSSASARMGYQFNERQKLSVSVLSQHVNGGYDPKTNSKLDDRSLHDLDAVSASWVAQWLDNWRSTATVGQSRDRYETRTSSSYLTRTDVKNASWANQLTFGAHAVRATLEGREDRLDNTDVAQDKDVQRAGALGLGYDWQGRGFAFQSSVREDHHSAFGSHLTGSLAGGYELSKQWRVRASWGTAFRAPTLYQRFSSPYGQADLRPETSRTSELGLHYQAGSTQWGVTVFDSHVNDLITFDSATSRYGNVSAAVLKGVEITGALSVASVRLSGSVNFDDPKNAQTDKLLPRRAHQHGKLRAETTVAQWTLGAQVLLSGKRLDTASSPKTMGGYAVWGLDAQRQLSPQWKLILRADNLMDKFYQTALNYDSAPRTVFVGLRWTPDL